MTDEHRTDGFALKRNVRQKIEIDTDIAIIGKTETETDIDFEKKSKNKIETDIDPALMWSCASVMCCVFDCGLVSGLLV